jgi:hypothetical protein
MDMDSHGQDPSGGHEPDDAAIERPPSIGLDERRMHVRAYNYWASLLGSRLYPALDDFDPAALDDFGPHGVVLNFTDPAQPQLIFIGKALRVECGLDEDITRIADVPNRSLLSRLTDHYLEVIANRAPIGFEAEFIGRRGNNTMYRGILMPLSSDGETIDNIYGVINWKELADAATTAALVVEVDRALAQRPTLVSMNPVWADSPSARMLSDTYAPSTEDDETDDLIVAGRDDALDARLAAAREASRQAAAALGRALALTYDLALASEDDPLLPMLLAAEGIARPSRVSMNTVVRLVLGKNSDRAVARGIAALLEQGLHARIPDGAFEAYLEEQDGGMTALFAAARATRRR